MRNNLQTFDIPDLNCPLKDVEFFGATDNVAWGCVGTGVNDERFLRALDASYLSLHIPDTMSKFNTKGEPD